MPKISIIVPNYNTEKYLPRCLESLIHQTFKDIEIILIDDGSKDKSVDIIKKYAEKDSRIRLIEQENAGPAKARNQGLERATGKYLMFCDSDDWYEPNMCEVMYNTIQNKKVDVVCCHNFFDWEEDLSQNEKEDRLVEKYYNPNRSGKYILNKKNILSTNVVLWNKIWRRDLIEKYHIRFPDGHEHDDDAFWYMYSFVAKNIYCLKDKLYHYFLRAGSIMSTQVNKKPKNRMDRLAIAEYTLKFLLLHNLQEKHRETMVHIFWLELKNGIPFFTPEELHQNCQYVTQLLSDKLKTKECFLYDDSEILLLKNKRILKLIYEWIWYRLCEHFWGLSEIRRKEHYQRYIVRIKKNKLYWKHKKSGLEHIKNSLATKEIPIVFSTDKNYFPYFLVALESIIQNSTFYVGYKIILLHADLTEADEKTILEKLKNYPNFSIRLINVSDLAEKYELNKFMTINHLRVSAYYRLLIGEILKEYDKIIYLDCDLILNKDIALLYETDIEDNYLAAVLDRGVQDYYLKSVPEFKKYMQRLGMKTVENYFNSGVLIMNLKAIRENKLLEKFLQLALKNTEYFHDQNVLNVSCEGKVFYLDSSWNVQCCNRISKRNFGIIHYAGNKPWNKKGVNLEKYWWNYAKNTFFYQKILSNYKKNARQHKKINFKKLKYKILYKLSFGRVRQKYKQKYKEAR